MNRRPTAGDNPGQTPVEMDLHTPAKSPAVVLASGRYRREVICAVVVVSFLTILARVGISGAKVEMARDLTIGDRAFGMVFGAFALGYAVFMIPCGVLADRWGSRKSLSLSVFFWSLFTLATGLASGVIILIIIRFLFGLAEAGVYPQATRALHNWTLPQERGLALGLLNMGSRFGAAFGLLATPICVEWLGWRESFALLGIVGGIWAGIWFWRFRDRPDIKLNKQERNVVSAANERLRPVATNKIPWRAFASSLNFYLILYQYFASQFTFFFCLSWLLPFLTTRYGVTTAGAGVYSCVPLCCGALAMWISGVAVDRIYKMGKWKSSRGLPARIGFGLAALTLLPAPFMPNPVWFIVCFALTIFGLDLTVSPSWTVCCDVGEMYSGTLSAAMNTAGALGSLASSLIFPLLVGWAGTIKEYFFLAALLNAIALVCWNYVEPSRSLFQEAKPIESGAIIPQRNFALL
jgi:MFS transporter, ACS family, glucarate transporter